MTKGEKIIGTKFQEIRAKYVFGKSFGNLKPEYRNAIVESEVKIRKLIKDKNDRELKYK